MIENDKVLKWSRPVEILLVDDNPADVMLTQEAFSENKLCNNLSIVNDGVEAMDFLHKRGQYTSVPTPDIILLDLNMPRKDGRPLLVGELAGRAAIQIGSVRDRGSFTTVLR